MKLWHDDVRRPPDPSWFWVRTNDAARRLLENRYVSEISMDHDLGGHFLDPDETDAWLYKGPDSGPKGTELVSWMIEHDRVPDLVTIHSWNGPGAATMRKELDAGRRFLSNGGILTIIVRPYTPPDPRPELPICRCGHSCWRVGGETGCIYITDPN